MARKTSFISRELLPFLRFLGFFLFMAALFEMSISSCASKSSPGGGPRDTLAPQLDTAFPPNLSIQFKAKEIELRFEEYVELKNPFDQINISPLLPEDLEVEGRGKKVMIKLGDSLKENTTYIISFGTALADLNEGNVNKNFKYVFSTGTYIDSLEIRGHLNDAYTGEAKQEFLVALYSADRASSRDTFLEVERPDYYAFSSEAGDFTMTNIKGGKYLLAAFEDKDGDFKLNNLKSEMAFWPDTILISPDTVYDLKLLSYAPKQVPRYYGAKLAERGLIQFSFNEQIDSFKIKALNVPEDSAFFYRNRLGDTLNYYFDFKADSILFELNYDTLFVDSIINVRLRRMGPLTLKIASRFEEMRPKDTIFLRSNRPILKWEADSVLFITKKDSLNLIPQKDSADPFRWFFPPPHKSDIRFELKKGAFASRKLDLAFPKSFDFALRTGEDLGSIYFKVVVADTVHPYLLQILEDNDKPYLLQSFSDSTMVSIRNEIPRKFKAFLIQDRDGDGAYSPGDYLQRILPEKRLQYQEALEIRANWELDLEWNYIPN